MVRTFPGIQNKVPKRQEHPKNKLFLDQISELVKFGHRFVTL
jgi:hypothetical protein